MKLVLYSGGFADENYQMDINLISLVKTKEVSLTFIPSCHYHSNEDYEDIVKQYKALGVKKFLKFDIDQNFSSVLKKTALGADIIYLGGGNTFYFLKKLKESGMLDELKSWATAGGILSGMSAGAIILTKKIETASFPSFDRDDNDDNLKNLSAMDLVNFEFFPHYKNSKRYDDELILYSKKNSRPLYACVDGGGIVITNEETRFIGNTACFINGTKYFINKLMK
jgi:dipeptidase E